MTDTLKEFLTCNQDGFFHIGHSSALFKINSKLFLCDPIWGDYNPYGNNWVLAPKQIDCEYILNDIYGCFVSHQHADHLCPEILAKLHCPIYIKSGRPDLKNIIEQHSKFPVIEVPEYTFFEVGDDIEAYFVPHNHNAIDSSFFIRNKSYCAYMGNDNFLTKPIIDRIKQDITSVDIALIPYTYIHWWPFLQSNISEEEKQISINRMVMQSIDQAQMFRSEMNPKLSIPFGASLYYAEGSDHILNKTLASPYDLEGFIPLIAGDYALSDGSYKKHHSRHEHEFQINKIVNASKPVRKISAPPKIEWGHLKRILQKLKRARFKITNYEIIINGIVCDTENLQVALEYKRIEREKSCLRFTFEAHEFRQWLEGEITFEEAIGTRRFTVERIPNTYNPKVFDFMNLFL